jgi:hypothetical protein
VRTMFISKLGAALTIHLIRTLEMVNQHVKQLKNRKRNIFAWVWTKKDQAELLTLNGRLSDALSLFGVSS